MLWFKYYLDIFSFLGNWDPPTQRSLHILNPAPPTKLGNPGGTSQNKSLLLRKHQIYCFHPDSLRDDMPPQQKSVWNMPAVCKLSKR